jgi:multidrug efflux pump subunit AcrB
MMPQAEQHVAMEYPVMMTAAAALVVAMMPLLCQQGTQEQQTAMTSPN